MKRLVTGASGFIGRTLVAYLKERYPSDSIMGLDITPGNLEGVKYLTLDLKDANAVTKVIKEIEPDIIFHLAGNSRVSEETPLSDYFYNNAYITEVLFEALSQVKKKSLFFLASSVHVYGNQTGILNETSDLKPATAYGFTKFLAEESLRVLLGKSPHVSVIVGRLYSCLGPGQPLGFMASDLCRRVAELPETPNPKLKVGSLSGLRGFIDVRDAVKIFADLAEAKLSSNFEVFNLSSEQERTVEEFLKKLLKISQKSPHIEISEAHSANRFQGPKISVDKLKKQLPNIKFHPLHETIKDMWEVEKRAHGK